MFPGHAILRSVVSIAHLALCPAGIITEPPVPGMFVVIKESTLLVTSISLIYYVP